MKVTIGLPEEQVTFPSPGVRKVSVVIHYTTENGYQGTVILDKSQANQAGIAAAVKADVEHLDKVIGTTLEIK